MFDTQEIEDMELKSILEATLNDTINDLKKLLPQEPNPTDNGALKLIFNYKGTTFSRFFLKENKIIVNLKINIGFEKFRKNNN